MVEETLKGVDADRKAYRLIGDVLVERKVSEVLPAVQNNHSQVRLATDCVNSASLTPRS